MGAASSKLGQDPFKSLREAELFQFLPDDAVRALAGAASFTHLAPGQVFSREGPRSEERYAFVLEGQLAVTIDRAGAIQTGKFFKNRSDRDVVYLDILAQGDFLSDAYVPEQPDESGARLECVGLVATTLARIPKPALSSTMRAHPKWAEEMNLRNASLRQHHKVHKRPDLRLAQDFFLRYGYSFATTLKVIDLQRCIGCNACEDSCATRHGSSRIVRHGPVLGLLAFPVACRTCVDHRCVDACGFDAIHYTDKEEVQVDTKKCVGCTACQAACPNDVISMVKTPFTLADFPNPMPDTDPNGLTNVPGLYLVGEASGDALIKMAINSGKRAIDHLSKEISPSDGKDGVVDVLIVGSGPAGLSAALSAKEIGLSYLVIDKGTPASTIRNFPRHKVVMAEPAHIPLIGDLWFKDTTKEELIQMWTDIIKKAGLVVKSEEEVKKVERSSEGVFVVGTAKGSYKAKRVVLATGTRGAPRKIGAPGEASPRVQYLLTEPDDFKGKRVLVVGGGDSAVEAAMSLADAPGTTVTLSYRKDSFGRIKGGNQKRIDQYSAEGKVKLVFNSSVSKIEQGKVWLKVEGAEEQQIDNDQIFALLGAEPPTKFFEKCGISVLQPNTPEMQKLVTSRGDRWYASKCDHCTGHEDQACISACPTEAIFEIDPIKLFPAPTVAKSRTQFRSEPFVLGIEAVIGRSQLQRFAPTVALFSIALTLLVGLECFLRATVPEASAAHFWAQLRGYQPQVLLSSGTGLGFQLGIVGTVLMALTALYPIHSRLGLFKGMGRTRFFLAAHILAGILGPAFVTYHTRLKLDRWPTVAFIAMWSVVLSGFLGRYLYTYFRRGFGLAELDMRAQETDKKRVLSQWDDHSGKTKVLQQAERLATAGGPTASAPMPGALSASFSFLAHQAFGPAEQLWMSWVTLRHLGDARLRKETVRMFAERAATERKAAFMRSAENASSLWRRIHLGCTVILFVVATAHIIFAMLFKAT